MIGRINSKVKQFHFWVMLWLFLLSQLLQMAHAWSAPIHKEIFAIAWLELSPEEQQQLLLQLHAPPWSTYPPLAVATWADRVKGHGSDPHWHYINQKWA